MLDFPNLKKRDCLTCDSRKTNVFCDLPEKSLEILNNSKVISQYKKGQAVFYAGNFPPGLYCVSSGVIKLESNSSSGNSHILRMVGAGGVLGYRSLFAEESYEANAIVHEDATICLIPKTAINEVLTASPEIGLKFLAQVSRELRAAESRMCGLTDKAASERIAESILFLKENFKDQNWTRKDIAEWAGTTPETVMRTLSDFADEKIIELSGRKILILNKTALSKIANLIH